MTEMTYYVDWIGYNGPMIIWFISIVLLSYNSRICIAFIIGSLLNQELNSVLKILIKQPRPSGQIRNLIDNDIFTGAHVYGMPSGHAQTLFFSVSFLYYVIENFYILIGLLFIGGLTIYQRWKYHRHSLLQLIVGSTIGWSFGYGFYTFVRLYR